MALPKSKSAFRAGRVVAADAKWTGEEQDWTGWETWPVDRFYLRRDKMLTFYSYYLTELDLRPDLAEWMQKNDYGRSTIDLIAKMSPADSMLFTASKLARAINRGMPGIHPKAIAYFKTLPMAPDAIPKNANNEIRRDVEVAITKLQHQSIAEIQSIAGDPNVAQIKTKANPHHLLKEKVNREVITKLDEMMDAWCVKGDDIVEPISLVSLIRDNNTPAAGCVIIKTWLENFVKDIQSALDRSDQAAIEGYADLGKGALRSRVKAIGTMLDEVIKLANAKKQLRKPRTKKVKDASKQIARLKWQQTSKDYAITSIQPGRIPSSYQLYAFNTKYRTLSFYQASGPKGFEIKGSSIKGFCPKNSYTMAIRKPDVVLLQIVGSSPKKLSGILDQLTTKKRPANGRSNDQTLFVRVIETKPL
jgi:hypothetical protein